MVKVKPKIEVTKGDAAALTHSPFAALASHRGLAENLAKSKTPSVIIRARPVKPLPPRKLHVRLESKGRSGKVVTRIMGLPAESIEALASHLRKALGCGATVEGNDLLLLGSLVQRALDCLEKMGDLRAIAHDPACADAAQSPASNPREVKSTATLASGTNRSDVQRGRRVAIVMKADQSSGALTEGVVRDILTNASVHPRGIKVRLESGEVGRVKFLYE